MLFSTSSITRRIFKTYPFEEAYLREKALAFRAGLSMLLIMLGGIKDMATMDRAMADGFEFVAMGRALLREPDLINRMQAGETAHGICIHCNQCMPTSTPALFAPCAIRGGDYFATSFDQDDAKD